MFSILVVCFSTRAGGALASGCAGAGPAGGDSAAACVPAAREAAVAARLAGCICGDPERAHHGDCVVVG